MRLASRLVALMCALACAPTEPARGPEPGPRVLTSSAANSFDTPKPLSQYRRVTGGNRLDWPDPGETHFLLIGGRRLLERDGGFELAETVGATPLIAGTRVPSFAGGGFVFWSREGVYRSSTFLGRLKPLVATGFSPDYVSFGPGFLLVSSNQGERVAIDGRSGARVTPLPPGLVDIAASTGGRVVAALELGRFTISTDRNASFHEVQGEIAGTVTALSQEPLGFVVDATSLVTLSPEGRLSEGPLPRATKPRDPRWPLTEQPLERAVRQGIVKGPERALVTLFAAIAEVDLGSGELVSVGPQILPGNPDCQLLRQGDELLMKCLTRDSLAIVSQPTSEKPVIERTFAGKPNAKSGFGQLVVEASCDGSKATLAVCVRGNDGAWKSLGEVVAPLKVDATTGAGGGPAEPPPETALGYALAENGGVIAFVNAERKGYVELATGRFVSLGADVARAVERQSSCRLDARGSLRCLTREGPLAFAADGKLEPPALRFSWVGSSAERVLGLDERQQLFQSTDWGRSFTEVLPPPMLDRNPDSSSSCSEVGCRLGSWLRIGWQALPPAPLAAPEAIALPPAPVRHRPVLSCQRLREPSRAVSPALSPETSERQPGLGNDIVPGSYFRLPLQASAPHQESLDPMGLRGVASGKLDAETSAEAHVTSARPLAFRFVDYFDPKAKKQSASIALGEIVRAARAVGNPTPDFAFEDQNSFQLVPVLGQLPGKTAGFVLNQDSFYLWVQPGRVTPIPLEVNNGNWTIISAVAEPDGALSLLVDDGGTERQVQRVAAGASSVSFGLPANIGSSGAVSSIDALGLSAEGELAVLRFSSGLSAPSKEYPVLAYRPGKLETLAPWSSLRLASDPACAEKGGYRALVLPTESWLELAGSPGHSDDDDWGMTMAVRWSTERVCLEALELGDETFSIFDEGMLTRVAASFVGKPEAARLGFTQGYELRQPLSCTLAASR